MNILPRIGLIIIYLFFVMSLVFAKAGEPANSVSGFVTDSKSGEALIGANVYLKEIKQGGTTNISGYFVITDVPYGTYTAICTYVGYKPFTTKVTVAKNDAAPLNIKLVPRYVETKEVVVSADSVRIIDKLYEKPVSKMELNSAQINQIPRVIEADLLRSLQTLPGITALSDFSSALYVRGGTPDQNLYMIDGADVYNPEHAFGIFSTFNTYAIKKVEISKGGFGAEYGGRLSSVLDVTNLDGNRNEFTGVANVSLLSASTTLQAPLGDFGSLSGSIRRTYLDKTYAKWNKDIPNYYFIDGNLKAFFDLGIRDKLTVSYFGSKDNLDLKFNQQKSSKGFLYEWGNQTGSLNWRHLFGNQLFLNFWTTYSEFSSNFDFQVANVREKNRISDLSIKGALEYYASQNTSVKFGFEQKFLSGMLQQDFQQGKVDAAKHPRHTMLYGSINSRPIEKLIVDAGARANIFISDKTYINYEPRFSAKYRIGDTYSIKAAAGKYYQYLNRIPRLFFASIWTSVDEYVQESSSSHYIFGMQKEVDQIYSLEVEAYYKTYNNIYQYNQLAFADIIPDRYQGSIPVYSSSRGLFNNGDGKSYGLEFLFKRDVGPISGWVSLSWSRTEYIFEKLNQGKEFIPRQDRAVVANAVINLDWNGFWDQVFDRDYIKRDTKWFIGLNFVYSTGQPITVPASAYYINTLPDWNDVKLSGQSLPGYNLYPSELDKYRLPPYIRLDLSVTYEIEYKFGTVAPYLQIFNAGNRKNVWFINYNEELIGGVLTQTIDKTGMLPLLPSIGVTIKF